MSPSAPCYAVCHHVQGGRTPILPLQPGAWGQGWEGAAPHSHPHTNCFSQPGGSAPALPRPGLLHCAQGGAASWASQPASAGCGWPTSSVPGPARAWLRWWSTDTRPAVLPSCGNLDPPRFVCTPASLLALPTQPHSTHPMHTHTHTLMHSSPVS